MILLVNPNLMKPPVSPVALDYLGQALEQSGFQVRLLDLSFESDIPAAIRAALTGRERLVAVTVRNTDDCFLASQDFCLDRTREIVQTIKSFTSAPVVVGGVGYSIFPREALEFLEADMGIVGEGEETLCWIAHLVARRERIVRLPGVVVRDGPAVELTHTPTLDLASMDLSARSVIDNRRYLAEGGMVGFETKRGCDRSCIYCADPVAKGTSVRTRDPANVALELKNLLDRGVDTFHTCDSEFNIPLDHAFAVCEAIEREKLGGKIQWYAYAAPSPFPERLAEAMRRAGCVGIDFGVDHADDSRLACLGRTHRVSELRDIAARCKRHGIVTMYDLLLGGPGETRLSILNALDALETMEIDRVGVSLGIRIYPKTPLARLVKREGFHPGNANLRGRIENNENLLRPVYYVSAELGDDVGSFLRDRIGGDERFFFGGTNADDGNYNYNNNSVLVEAIRSGQRGAFWDILRRIACKKA